MNLIWIIYNVQRNLVEISNWNFYNKRQIGGDLRNVLRALKWIYCYRLHFFCCCGRQEMKKDDGTSWLTETIDVRMTSQWSFFLSFFTPFPPLLSWPVDNQFVSFWLRPLCSNVADTARLFGGSKWRNCLLKCLKADWIGLCCLLLQSHNFKKRK